jgi:geranylgeranyl pyrophosphate synthase
MLRYQIQTGGKRLRAILPLLIADALGSDAASILPFGAACEILHNASLVHDDIQDGDTARRDQPTVWKKFGVAQAINLGDAMIAYTLLLMHRLQVPAALRDRATTRLFLEMLRVIEGQIDDLEFKHRPDVSLEEYLHMVEGKTSRLFALPMGGAALLCGAPAAVEEALVEAACHVGTLFQVQDDILNVFGPVGRDRIGNDIREGKRTLLVVHCLQHSGARDASRLRAILEEPSSSTSEADIDEAKSLFEASGSLAFCFDELERRRLATLSIPALAGYPKLRAVLSEATSMFLRPVASVRSALSAGAVGCP